MGPLPERWRAVIWHGLGILAVLILAGIIALILIVDVAAELRERDR